MHFAGLIQVSIEPSDSVAVEVSTEGRLNCVANGYQADMFMYQWRLNGTDINDATDKTLVISSATESDGGRYDCTVTNHWGETITSDSTELLVTSKSFLPAPCITLTTCASYKIIIVTSSFLLERIYTLLVYVCSYVALCFFGRGISTGPLQSSRKFCAYANQ